MTAIRIITGGQTGVDRAALEVATERSIPYGGWCPRGGWAEDMSNPPGLLATYPLMRETPLGDPAQRTQWNVRDSDATLIVVDARGVSVSRGTELARVLAGQYGRPFHIADLSGPDAVARTVAWLRPLLKDGSNVALAIGGPRESEAPGIHTTAKSFIRALLSQVDG